MSKRTPAARHFAASASTWPRTRDASRCGSSVTYVEMSDASFAPVSRTVSATSSGVLNIRWLSPIASTPSSPATSTMRSSASSVPSVTVVLMLTRSGAWIFAAASCKRLSPAAVRSNVPFTPRARSCSSPGPSIETLMCLRNPALASAASASARSGVMIVPLVVRYPQA